MVGCEAVSGFKAVSFPIDIVLVILLTSFFYSIAKFETVAFFVMLRKGYIVDQNKISIGIASLKSHLGVEYIFCF